MNVSLEHAAVRILTMMPIIKFGSISVVSVEAAYSARGKLLFRGLCSV